MKHFLAACLCAPFFACSAQADTVELEAVLNTGDARVQVSALMDYATFLETGEQISLAGLRLFDVESTRLDGRRVYVGLWRPGAGESNFDGPMNGIDFGNKMRAMRADNMRLEDFEVFRNQNGGRRYLGVWRNGAGRETLVGPVILDAFLARGAQLAEDGQSLVDLEVEIVNGTTLYHGLFRTEVGGTTNWMTAPVPRTAFVAERDQRIADGWHLIDVETVGDQDSPLYAGVWRKDGNPGPSVISALRPLGEFRNFLNDQGDMGRWATDLELRRFVPETETDDDPPDPDQDPGPTTADLPGTPDWVEITYTASRVVIHFGPNLGGSPSGDGATGFLLQIHNELLPPLPINASGEIVFPDNICGLRVFHPSEVIWEDDDGQPLGPPFNSSSSMSQDPWATAAQQGMDFTGPMGACAGSGNWQPMFPLTDASTGAPTAGRLTFILPDAVGFLNDNAPLASLPESGLKPKDWFKIEISDLLKNITKDFLDKDADNGYCTGVWHYLDAACAAGSDNCPYDEFREMDLTGAC